MIKDLKIEKATKQDALGTLEVQHKAWLKTYPNEKVGVTIDDIEDRYKERFKEENVNKRKEHFENQDSKELILTARHNEKIVGYAYGVIEDDKNILQALYVDPSYHRFGIGTQLAKKLFEFFSIDKDVYVDVVDYNQQAINFYKKLGFVETGREFKDERFRMKSGAIFNEIEMKLTKVS